MSKLIFFLSYPAFQPPTRFPGIECLSKPGGTFYTTLFSVTLLPLIVVSYIWAFFGVIRDPLITLKGIMMARRCRGSVALIANRIDGAGKTLARAPYLSASVMILFVTLPVATKSIFSTFICEDFDDGERGAVRCCRYLVVVVIMTVAVTGSVRLVTDMSIDCSAVTHKAVLVYCICMILVYPVGVPLCFFLMLYHQRRDILCKEDDLVHHPPTHPPTHPPSSLLCAR
jgi:hypothetical protein